MSVIIRAAFIFYNLFHRSCNQDTTISTPNLPLQEQDNVQSGSISGDHCAEISSLVQRGQKDAALTLLLSCPPTHTEDVTKRTEHINTAVLTLSAFKGSEMEKVMLYISLQLFSYVHV